MLLRQLDVRNFRSISAETFEFNPVPPSGGEAGLGGLSILIGKNNTGKTNVLDAARIVLEGTSKDVSEDDFHNRMGDIEICATFAGARMYLPLCEVRHRRKVEERVDEHDCVVIRRVVPAGTSALGKIEIRDRAGEFGTPTGIDAGLKTILPEVIAIMPLDDPAEEATGRGNRTLGKLLKQILQTVQAQVQPQLDEAYRNAQSLLNVVQVDEDGRLAERDERVPDLRRIESTVTTYLQETFPRARARLRVDLPAVDEILGQVALTVLDGGVETPMHRQGHGLQRALYLGLLQTLAEEIRRQGQAGLVRPFLLMVEEPELFLHPAAQERMRDALETISTKGQVLVATHSPLMVSPKSLRQVILLEKTPSPSTGKEETRRRGALGRQGPTATERELISLLNLQRSSQIFFSDTVVLVEGIGDMYLLQAIVERVARSSPSSLGLGIVEVGGKDKLLKFKAILDELGLRTYAVADLDFLAEGAGEAFGGDARYSQFCEQLNRRVADLCPDLGDADARTRARRRLMTELCREELRQQRDELCARLACQGIFVLREGEMHEYAGLTDTSKGRYLIAAREIVDRERAVKHLDEIGQIVGSLSGLAASAAEPPQEGINT